MPKVARKSIPEALYRHLLRRVYERHIGSEQLLNVLAWLEKEPFVPEGQWYIRLPGVTVCGEGSLVRTFLTPQQTPVGQDLSSKANDIPKTIQGPNLPKFEATTPKYAPKPRSQGPSIDM